MHVAVYQHVHWGHIGHLSCISGHMWGKDAGHSQQELGCVFLRPRPVPAAFFLGQGTFPQDATEQRRYTTALESLHPLRSSNAEQNRGC